MKPTPRLSSAGFAGAALAAVLLAGCSPSGGDALSSPAHAAVAAPAQSGPAAVARGKIEVDGGLLELGPGVEGTVQQLPVKEGQSVQRGQLLLRMADDASRADLSVAESEWRLAQVRQKAKAARLPQLKAMLARWQTAAREGAADAHSVEEAAQQLRDAQSEAEVAQAEVQVAQAKVEQLRALRKRLEVHAPEGGTIVRVRTHVGSQAAPAHPVIILLPGRPLVVRAELNESFANAVREGMRATVVFDGDAGGSVPALPQAKVLRISPVFGAAHLQDDVQRGPVRVIECVLAFDQPPAGARVGQNVRVTFHE
ncbi:HlyD family efflux transporter periplasmic adaptor subunit [Diaphorobacter ruginosibacter]|uniref:HlyD family efflux transporter periplasmic adaptor subunit n=1 Tax=Diaphorobacter ruginosibacter TaxID=1715720 RepID=A0A7G9RNW5_9BURK|nr:HlyD family efflux transporter periplasmic adaptor subunit [Diaphorobacter ruginosibacter]QNN57290.1 HlyD family efflux transporter periplasmic adaptor subunit [Diaphorobacter ruginosibacter]